QLPDTARPTAYRLDLTIDPSQERFSGTAEIDVELRERTQSIFLHGRGLNVSRVTVRQGRGVEAQARWTQVNPLGVARVEFPQPIAPGRLTLRIDYDAPFEATAQGLYRTEVGGAHYAWTQFEPVEARSAFPGFDEPRFKTPYTVTITAPQGSRAITNGADAGSAPAGNLVRHRFATTPAIPSYLVAFAVGPFDMLEGILPANSVRRTPLVQRVFATRGNLERMRYALEETPRIIQLLEEYFGIPYPYPKLDQIASPLMGGAMENVGAVIYGDPILLLGQNAPIRQRQTFGMVVAHELAHQWFGNMVTPAWWEDTWLKESFANWMGYRIGSQWRPELNIQVGSIDEALSAMNTDALLVGRPIRQPITDSGAIDASFDVITYGKGGQVIDMIESYLGRETFQRGVQLHLRRFARSGTATADDFFQSLAQAAGDPRIVASMQSFVSQQGVPLVTFTRADGRLTATQSRYAPLGAQGVPATQWVVPLCIRSGGERTCTLLDRPNMPIQLSGGGWFMPNAGGHGYYRFDLPLADWDALIAAGPSLSAGEALATIDSLWASFRAGRVGPDRLIAAARSFARHSDSTVVVDSGARMAGLESTGLIPESSLPAFRRLIAEIYAPQLEAIGFNPARGAHAQDAPDRQRVRGDLVAMLANGARHEPTRAVLLSAAAAYLGGDEAALDLAFLPTALRLHVQSGGAAAAEALLARAIASSDTQFRSAAIGALASSGDVELARWLQGQLSRPGLRPNEIQGIGAGLLGRPETRDLGFAWLRENAAPMAERFGAGAVGRMVGLPAVYCDAARAGEIEAIFRPLVARAGRGGLALDRSVERVRNCAALKEMRAAEVAAAFR
ncbi:MAG TPA: M1 family metallopeptidase, partial [Allosphingosinicella sp.]